MRDLYYACNTYFDDVIKRSRKSLEEENMKNQYSALFKVIGLTVETRPDCIDEAEILRYIRYGVTRVQIGVQHTSDQLLKKINRKCYTKDTIRAMKMLKQAGFQKFCVITCLIYQMRLLIWILPCLMMLYIRQILLLMNGKSIRHQ